MINNAIQKAKEIPFVKGQRRIYSIVVDRKGNIVGEAANNYCKSHPQQAYYAKKVGLDAKIFLHAEVSAMLRAKGKGYKIFIARVDSKGNTLPAAPCVICSLALKESGIKLVEHTI